MSQRQRGQEITLRVAVDGQLLQTFKVKSFTSTPRTDLMEEDYLGEAQSDIDIQHNGWDVAFSVDEENRAAIDFLTTITTREENHQAHPKITATVIYTYRSATQRPVVEVYPELFLKVASRGAGGRKERINCDFEGKCKTRQVMTASS